MSAYEVVQMAITGELCNPGFRYCTQWCIIYQFTLSIFYANNVNYSIFCLVLECTDMWILEAACNREQKGIKYSHVRAHTFINAGWIGQSMHKSCFGHDLLRNKHNAELQRADPGTKFPALIPSSTHSTLYTSPFAETAVILTKLLNMSCLMARNYTNQVVS